MHVSQLSFEHLARYHMFSFIEFIIVEPHHVSKGLVILQTGNGRNKMDIYISDACSINVLFLTADDYRIRDRPFARAFNNTLPYLDILKAYFNHDFYQSSTQDPQIHSSWNPPRWFWSLGAMALSDMLSCLASSSPEYAYPY